MERTEQEQIADLITERITAVVKQTLLEERSVFINQINSHFAETLKSYFEQQLAIQRQEFEVELQTKIDELKFQHYEQLERLGQAVEQVMSANPDDDMDDEVDEQIYDQYAEEESESELFADTELMQLIPEINLKALDTLESEYSDENLNLFDQDEKIVNDQIENPLGDIEQDLITNQELNLFAETASWENDDSSLISAASEVIPNLSSAHTWNSLETSDPFSIIDQDFEDLDSEISPFESLAANEVNPEDELDFLEPSVEISEEPSLFDLGFDLNDDSEQLLEPDLDSELDIFDQAEETEEIDSIGLSTESELFTESVSLDDLSDSLNLETLENDQNIINSDLESPKEEQESIEISDPFDDLVPNLSYAESPEPNEFEEDITEADLSSWQFLEAIAQAEISTDQAMDNFNQDIELNNQVDQLNPIEAQNPELVTQSLSLDDELNQFAEIASLEDFNDDLTLESDDQELELTDEFEAPDPFEINDEELNSFASLEFREESGQIEADQDFLDDSLVSLDILESDLPHPPESNPQINDQELSDPFSILTSDESLDFAESPEIVYEGEESNFEMDLESEELSDSDRLNLELEQELNAFETAEINIPELQDQDLTKFADLEAVEDFWADDDRPESTITNSSTFRDLWHLGIDFGYAAFRACLFNQGTGKTYPLSFTGEPQITANIKKENDKEAIALKGFKQFLRLGIPYQSEDKWQPQVQWSNNQSYSLKDFQIPAQDLLTQIKHTASHSELDSISEILENIETVILGHPHSWSDAYIFNLKEIVLASGLVSSIDQVLVIDQAIALISGCESSLEFSSNDQQLFIDSGALTTTLAFSGYGEKKFVDLEYAGLGIDQDIVLQLLYPQTKDKFPATKFIQAGEPNPTHRSNVQQFLSKTAIGLEALAVAEEIKLFFCQNPTSSGWQGNLGGKVMKISSLDLEVKVIQPFIQSLNDAVEQMIDGITLPEAITGIVITGGTALLPAIYQWLESKFANAQVVELPNSNLAQGLAIAPTYAQDLDINRHQYSDYFLLSEICALNLQESVSLEQLIKKLQNRGVNAKSCSDRLAQILLGQLPAGVLPWHEPEKSLILPDPDLNLQLLTNRLFTPVSDNLYAPNPDYAQILGSYLHTLESSSNQNFSEPLVFPSFVVTS